MLESITRTLKIARVVAALTDAQLILLHTVVPLLEYEADYGALPEALADLVPTYLERVPVDPFGGAPLRYVGSERTVDSIGMDFVDSGGSDDDGWDEPFGELDEPTLPVPQRPHGATGKVNPPD